MLRRLRCFWFGCREGDDERCQRCQVVFWDFEYIHSGAIHNPIAVWTHFRMSWLPRRCRVCRERFLPKGDFWRMWCSAECDAKDETIPF